MIAENTNLRMKDFTGVVQHGSLRSLFDLLTSLGVRIRRGKLFQVKAVEAG